MGWTVRGSNPGGVRFSTPVQTGPGAHPASCTMGTRSFPGVKSGWIMTLTPHPLLVPWSRKSRAIPLLPVWAIRPVQSLSPCTRVHFTFFLFHGITTKGYTVVVYIKSCSMCYKKQIVDERRRVAWSSDKILENTLKY